MITHNGFLAICVTSNYLMNCQIKLRNVLHKKQAINYYFKNKAILQFELSYMYYFLNFLTVLFKYEATWHRKCYTCWLTTQVVLPSPLVETHKQSRSSPNTYYKCQDRHITSSHTKASFQGVSEKGQTCNQSAHFHVAAIVRVWEQSVPKSVEWYFLRFRLRSAHLALWLTNLVSFF